MLLKFAAILDNIIPINLRDYIHKPSTLIIRLVKKKRTNKQTNKKSFIGIYASASDFVTKSQPHEAMYGELKSETKNQYCLNYLLLWTYAWTSVRISSRAKPLAVFSFIISDDC